MAARLIDGLVVTALIGVGFVIATLVQGGDQLAVERTIDSSLNETPVQLPTIDTFVAVAGVYEIVCLFVQSGSLGKRFLNLKIGLGVGTLDRLVRTLLRTAVMAGLVGLAVLLPVDTFGTSVLGAVSRGPDRCKLCCPHGDQPSTHGHRSP